MFNLQNWEASRINADTQIVLKTENIYFVIQYLTITVYLKIAKILLKTVE